MASDFFNPERRARFCELLAQHGNRTRAAKAVGVTMNTVRGHRKEDPAFAADMDAAFEEFYDDLEMEATRRARDGVPEPVFYKGVEVGEVQRYSDGLMQFLLKGRRRDVFGDKSQVEMTGKDGGPIEMTSTERAKLVEKLLAKAAERKALVE